MEKIRFRHWSVRLVLVAALAMLTAACALGGERGSGTALTETIAVDLNDVRFIDVSDAWQAEVRQGETARVEVTVDDNLRDRVEVAVDDATLKVSTEGSARPDVGFNVIITLPTIDGIDVSDATDLVGTGLSVSRLEASDASSIVLTDSRADALDISADDASDVTVSGRAIQVDASASDASDIDLSGLTVDQVRVEVSDASEVDATRADRIAGSAEDASTVRVGSGAVVDVTTSDASDVVRAS